MTMKPWALLTISPSGESALTTSDDVDVLEIDMGYAAVEPEYVDGLLETLSEKKGTIPEDVLEPLRDRLEALRQ